MKRTFQVLLIFSVFVMTVSAQENNNFYDNTKTSLLKGPEICVDGEVQNPGLVELGKLSIHSVSVRESAFRDAFDSVIDLIVVIKNKKEGKFLKCLKIFTIL